MGSGLLFEDQSIDSLMSPILWSAIAPFLNVVQGEATPTPPSSTVLSSDSVNPRRDFKEEFVAHGFFHWDSSEETVDYFDVIDRLARGVDALVDLGYPASFIYAYDEAWALVHRFTPLLKPSNGGSQFLGDIFAWKVDPNRPALQQGRSNQISGWGPHRDRMGSDQRSFRPLDGTPMLSTSWLALTDALATNSCLHFVPAECDPGFRLGDVMGEDPLAAVFASNPLAYQQIRSCPIARGSFLHFSHRTIHWGSSVAPSASFHHSVGHPAQTPRIAMSWVVGDPSFEASAFACGSGEDPPICFSLAERLSLVCAQQINYGGQTGLTKHRKNLFFRIFHKHQKRFSEAYISKVHSLYYMTDSSTDTTAPVVKLKPVYVPDSPQLLQQLAEELEYLGDVGGMFE